MAREFGRNQRVGEQIRRKLATLIQWQMKDPRIGMVTIAEVRVNHDLSHAKVYITALADASEMAVTVGLLNKAASFLRRELARQMIMRSVPALHFIHDESATRGEAMDVLIAASLAADRHSGTDR